MNDDVFDEMNVVGHAFEIGFPKQTRVHVERRMLTIGQDAPIPPERILRAYFVPKRGQRPRVFVDVKRGRQIHVDVLTRDEGTRLLRALGWANDQRSIRFTGKPTTIGLVFAVAIGGLLLNGLGYFIGHFVNLLTLVAWTGLMYWSFRPRIDIGADGITIHQYFRKRFVSYRIVDRVRLLLQSSSTRNGGTVFEHFLVLERDNRPSETIKLDAGDAEQAWTEGVLDRVQTSLDAFHGRVRIDLPNELTRGQRSTKDWITALRHVGSGSRQLTYRVATVEPEQLLAVVESPTEPATVRAAAAVALARSATAEQRERLVKSTETVAEPRLRVALEAALGADEEALEHALASLEEAAKSEQR